MATAAVNTQIDQRKIEETLTLFVDEVLGTPTSAGEPSAEVMAGFIALMYGPALQELEKQ